MASVSMDEIGTKKVLAVREFKRNPVCCFFIAVMEDGIGLYEIQFSNYAIRKLSYLPNEGEKFMFSDIDPSGNIYACRKSEVVIYEVVQRPLSITEISKYTLEYQISSFSIFTHLNKVYALVGFWIVNSVHVIATSSWSIVNELVSMLFIL